MRTIDDPTLIVARWLRRVNPRSRGLNGELLASPATLAARRWSQREHAGQDGCGWICLDPGCPELAAGSWRPRTWWRSACRRRSRPSRAAHRALRERRRRAPPRRARAGAGRSCASARAPARAGAPGRSGSALAAHLSDALAVSYLSDDFAEAQVARQALAAVGASALPAAHRTDAQEWAAGIDAGLPGSPSADRGCTVCDNAGERQVAAMIDCETSAQNPRRSSRGVPVHGRARALHLRLARPRRGH